MTAAELAREYGFTGITAGSRTPGRTRE
ncbi:hypothetical protein MHPYR_10376 [uncultured Mycobacterium sp.]|uniref:Uncharacterized protein n=1 Tax=uncultured Mycobacterium sp. TaxID=171292 RepID=A0A1Y5P472_9MYCO|nr:hypothetical protein MHPYR_10376 [uncultured Mycobacterium sp.]